MKQDEFSLDHDTLAAYISNTLLPDDRAAVTRALVRNPQARELLAMAASAMGEARERQRGQLRVDSRRTGPGRTGSRSAA